MGHSYCRWSDPVNGFDLKDERTGTREKRFTGFDPLDEGVAAGFYTFFLAIGNDPRLHSVSFVIG